MAELITCGNVTVGRLLNLLKDIPKEYPISIITYYGHSYLSDRDGLINIVDDAEDGMIVIIDDEGWLESWPSESLKRFRNVEKIK